MDKKGKVRYYLTLIIAILLICSSIFGKLMILRCVSAGCAVVLLALCIVDFIKR